MASAQKCCPPQRTYPVALQANGSAVSIGRAAVIGADGSVLTRAITRQLTNLAAGTADTDAVNVAQLKQVKTYADGIANTVKELTDKVVNGNRDFAGDDQNKVSVKVGETMEITGGAATNNLSDDNIGVVKKGENGVSIKLSKDLKASIRQNSTPASLSVPATTRRSLPATPFARAIRQSTTTALQL